MNLRTKFEGSWGRLDMKYKLSEIMDIIGGGTPKTSKPEYWNGDIPWLSVKDFNNDYRYVYETEKTITQLGLDNSSTKLLKRNDSIISARGTVGEMAMIPYPMAFNQSCYGLRAKEGLVDEEYLYYLIKHNVVVLKKNTHGSVFDTITRDTFDGIEVELPSLVEQKVVASILRDLDDKIEVNNEINKNLEEQAVVLFRSWFSAFSLSPNSPRVNSEFGEIPENFAVVKVGSLPMLVTDYVANGSFASLKANVNLYQEPNYAYFIRNTDLKSGSFGVYVDQHSYEFLSKSTLFGGEIIISNVGDVGSVFLCPKLDGRMTLGNNIIMLRPEDDHLRYYLYIWFKYLQGQALIQGIKGGSAQPKFNKTDFKNTSVLIPPKDMLTRFHETVAPMFETISQRQTETSRLADLRDTLLPQLMSGEIDVSNLDL